MIRQAYKNSYKFGGQKKKQYTSSENSDLVNKHLYGPINNSHFCSCLGKTHCPLLEYKENINYLLSLLQYGERNDNIQIKRGMGKKYKRREGETGQR
jgi:hypothetical protein